MGLLIDGVWRDRPPDTPADTGVGPEASGGRFVRAESRFRDVVTADGSSGFRAEPGRYHLYVALACPWAHRTLIVRALKGLEAVIGASAVEPVMGAEGWTFGAGATADPVNGARHLRDIYTAADPHHTGRVTVPVLWDRARGTIVSNESADIIRMLNAEFDAFCGEDGRAVDLYPADLRAEIDGINAVVYERVNNGVYRCGFAGSQAAYDEAFEALFATLDMLEARLSRQPWLVGGPGDGRITEADWRLFTTLVRFDAVYVGHFKCNRRRLADYPNLWSYTRALYQVPGVATTVDLDAIKQHYYRSHPTINPGGIVPRGPEIDFSAPHDRGRFAAG